jgi:hypothetical protein
MGSAGELKALHQRRAVEAVRVRHEFGGRTRHGPEAAPEKTLIVEAEVECQGEVRRGNAPALDMMRDICRRMVKIQRTSKKSRTK